MGKAIRWLKGLFGLKKESNSGDRKNKIPSCIGGLRGGATNSPEESPLMKSVYDNSYEEDQNRRAIAVANVTAVAADAAIAAAWAAVAFVRITSHNRDTSVADRRNYAALKIQTVFRGYLARKALKALKSLVKLQALVRGYLVRKETIKALNGMEALFRARSSVSEQRNRLQDDKFHSRRSFRRASETRSRRMSSSFHIPLHENLDTIDLDFEKPKSRLTRANSWAWAIDQTPSPIFTNSHRHSIPNLSTHYEYEPHFSTTQNTPRFAYTCGPNDYNPIYERVSKDDTFTSDPNYMAKTKSFRAKVRSHSAPKQRPDYGLGLGLKKKAGPIEVECGPRVEKLKSKSPSMIENSFKNLLMSRIGKSKGQ